MGRKMKDSGVEWIGQIPEDWTISSLSKIAIIKTGSTPKNQFLDTIGEIDWIKTNNLKEEQGVTSSDLKIKYENRNLVTMAKKGATLVSCIGDIGKMAFLFREVSYNQQINAVNFNKNIHPKFGFYLLFSQKEQHKSFSNGNVLQILNSVSQGLIKVAFPELKEQKKISEVLDKKTEQIEDIKSTIVEQIQTLEDYKKSVITEAVTKGLDKNVEMKDSGIEWIGEIPKHWKVTYLKSFFDDGKNKNKFGKETNLLSLSYGKIINKDINTQTGLLPQNFNNYNIVEEGSIVIRPTDLQNDKKSLRTGLVKEKGIITSAYINLKPKKNVLSKYFHYLLHCYDLVKVFYNMGSGVRQSLTYSEFSKLLVLNPGELEQKEIVSYLDNTTRIVDEAIQGKQKQLEVLEEYKKSLIYEHVTGKKEVGDADCSFR